jgi:hypothetical protein
METSSHVDAGTAAKIAIVSASKGISKSKMIVLLIRRFADESGFPIRMGRLVQYHTRGSVQNWAEIHMCLRADEYEYFQDLKKLFKLSVSLMIEYAAKMFIENISEIKDTDNYPFRNYVIVKEYIGDIICWKHIWGYPSEIERYLRC